MKKDWQKLTQPEQKVFEDKAQYLLEKGYVVGKTKEALAKEIYQKNG